MELYILEEWKNTLPMLPSNKNLSIQVQGLSKLYRIGVKQEKDKNLLTSFLKGLATPITNLKRIKSLKNIGTKENNADIFWANKNISFNVYEGEVVGIIGKNGAGKSTLLKILSHITKPTEGRIDLYGRVASLLEVGTGFNPELTGRENIFLNGTILGLTKKEIEDRYQSIVDFSGIPTFIETPVKRYSSGMKVRLAFAVAAHLDPEILIIDEVLAVGDAEFQRKCIGKMQELSHSSGRTVLFVSHNMAAVKSLCSRCVVLRKGELVFDGTPTDAINYYQNEVDVFSTIDFTETFVGNDIVRVQDFFVKPLVGKTISISSGVSFSVSFTFNKPNINFDISFELRSVDEVVVFHVNHEITTNNDSKQGLYRVDGSIPQNFLNCGVFYLSIIVGENHRYALYKGRDLVQFEVYNEVMGSSAFEMPGVTRPGLNFSHEYLGNQ